ncbi:MAG: class I SAM-dependent methyltransferase [Candidatus Thiodiazotropha sp. (ex Dulcina madagascariensis)]|nr:class I SAM-dependent methyltransferase [Candidatus Thiodiazotropha sp. (ex Dulcina madagascariensis)]
MPDCLSAQPGTSGGTLPLPDPTAQAVSDRLLRQIRRTIDRAGGAIPFDRFMEMALYAPGLGYYVAGSRKFGEQGDFITSPEVSPLFAQCLAHQAEPVLSAMSRGEVLEFGAGSGLLAADMLAELERLGSLPQRYLILEVSPELRARQQETLQARVPHLLSLVDWLDGMPGGFHGFVIANELLDALPVNRFRIADGAVEECFVTYDEQGLKAHFAEPVTPGLKEAVSDIGQAGGELPNGYVSEVNLRQASWLHALAGAVRRGAVILIDYGYSGAEYYHPQRNQGTLMCHYRHRAHSDSFRWVGLQDITSQVDFTAATRVALEAGFRLGGYTTQAHFLIANGLDTLLADSDPNDLTRHMALVQGVKRLTLPSEMGERFKVLGLLKDLEMNLQGFSLRDFCERL